MYFETGPSHDRYPTAADSRHARHRSRAVTSGDRDKSGQARPSRIRSDCARHSAVRPIRGHDEPATSTDPCRRRRLSQNPPVAGQTWLRGPPRLRQLPRETTGSAESNNGEREAPGPETHRGLKRRWRRRRRPLRFAVLCPSGQGWIVAAMYEPRRDEPNHAGQGTAPAVRPAWWHDPRTSPAVPNGRPYTGSSIRAHIHA